MSLAGGQRDAADAAKTVDRRRVTKRNARHAIAHERGVIVSPGLLSKEIVATLPMEAATCFCRLDCVEIECAVDQIDLPLNRITLLSEMT